MLERHFHQYVTKHLNEYHPLSNKQWGFQSGKSTVTALLSVTHDWFQALEAGQEVCSIFLRKAFDSVPHPPLVGKLANLGLNAHALSWITSWLTGSNMWLWVENHPWTHLFSLVYTLGLCAGSTTISCLDYTDNVSDVLLSDGNIYADDMVLYKPVKSNEDIHHLQMDIDHISGWVDCNNLTLNSNKCKTMVISRKQNSVKPQAQFTLNSEQVETFKYLELLLLKKCLKQWDL